MGRQRPLRALTLVLAAYGHVIGAAPPPVAPGFALDIDIGHAIHEAVGAENLRARIRWEQRQPVFELSADTLRLPAPIGPVTGLRLTCPGADVSGRHVACRGARLSARTADLAIESAVVDFEWDRANGQAAFSFPWPRLYQGSGRVNGTVDPAGLRAAFEISGLDIAALTRSPLLSGLELPVSARSGQLAMAGHIDTRTAMALSADIGVVGLEFSDPPGLHAGEQIAVSGRVRHGPDGTGFQLQFSDGAVFFDPWFLDFGEVGPVEIAVSQLRATQGAADASAMTAAEASLRIGTDAFVRGEGLRIYGGRLEQGRIDWDLQRLETVGEWLLVPALTGTLLGDSHYGGESQGRLVVVDRHLQRVSAFWRAISLTDTRGRLSVEGLTGDVDWKADSPGKAAVRVAAGTLFGIPVGSFESAFETQPKGFRLLHPLEIPVLDGGLRVDLLRVAMGPEGPEIDFEGGLRALDLGDATQILGWPPMAGRLAGMIPRVRYDGDGLRVDGRLLVQVFGGDVVLRDLRIRDLFGVAPTLEMSAEIRRIELQLLTGAFDFGRIEGRLSGRVDDLVLVGWEPQRMRLALATSTEDPGRRRISQRAVQNLADLGGGLQGAVSALFLRFFDDFGYRRLGFACDLEGRVCRMSGVVDQTDDSFVLVQGGGVPRIDVIGHNRRVDWPELIRRLNAVRGGPGPVVQ